MTPDELRTARKAYWRAFWRGIAQAALAALAVFVLAGWVRLFFRVLTA